MADHPRIILFGDGSIRVGEANVSLNSREISLISLFVLRETDSISRHEPASLLWPSASGRSARHSLSQAVYSINRKVPQLSILSGTRTHLYIGSIDSDVADFRRAIRSENWTLAASAYGGELMSGVAISGAEAFNEWLSDYRAQLNVEAQRVLEALLVDGNNVAATRLSTLLPIERRPTNALMVDAVAVEPSEPTEEEQGSSFGDAGASGSRFVGRQAQMEWLENTVTKTGRSGCRVVLIEGEPGIGKTALLERFARRRALRGSRVLYARAWEAEQNVPYGVVTQWLRDVDQTTVELPDVWVTTVEDAFPGVFQSRTAGFASSERHPIGEYRLLEAMRKVVELLAGDAPVLFALDNAHFADAASLQFIHYLTRRSAEGEKALLATVRRPLISGVSPFVGWENVSRSCLDPLTRQEIELWLRRLPSSDGNVSDVLVEELARRTGGNPLLLTSLLNCEHTDILRVPEQETDSLRVPDSVLEFFLPILRRLSADATVLLAAVSVAGEAVPLEAAARIAGLEAAPWRLSAALHELEASALIFERPDSDIGTKHGIISEIAVNQLMGAERRALYGRAARVLSERGAYPASVAAVQHDIAGERDRAFLSAQQAASASKELYATREREFFLKLALSNAPNPDAEVTIRTELSELFRHVGRPTEGIEVVSESAIAHASPAAQSIARASRLAIQLRQVHSITSIREVWEEIETLAPHLQPDLLAEIYSYLGAAAHDLGRTQDVVAAADKALGLLGHLPLTPATAVVATRCAIMLSLYTGFERGLRIIDRFLVAVDSDLEALAQCLWAQGTVLVAAGRLAEAEEALLKSVEYLERCCLYGNLFGLHNNLGVCYMEQGRFHEAAQQFVRATEVAREFLGPSGASVTVDNQALLAFEQQEYAAALQLVRAPPGDASKSSRSLYLRHAIIGLCSLELGLLAQAFEAKREIDLLFEQHDYWGNDISYIEALMARILVLEDKMAAAEDRLTAAIEVYRPRDLLCRARVELELGRIELKRDPVAALERAESMLETLRGTGAGPLIDRFEELADRARLRSRR